MTRRLQNPGFRFAACALWAALLTALCFRVTTVAYLTNDDNAIAYALAGYQTGTPEPVALFVNVMLGFPVSLLYRILPAVPWWSVLQLLALWFSETVLLNLLTKSALDAGYPFPVPFAAFTALFLLLLLPVTVQLTYTLTACVLGTAGVLLYASGIRKRNPVRTAGAVCMILVSFWMRDDSGLVVLCFLAAECFRLLLKRREGTLRVLLPALAAVLLAAASFGFNRAVRDRVNGEEYEEFFRWREQFSDFSRDTFEENPELYASVGWDEPLYLLADSWCYLDGRVNTETLRTISESSRHPGPAGAVSLISAFFRSSPESARMAVLTFLMTLLLLLFRPDPAGRWTGIGVLLGCWALTFYLGLTGRILLRSVQVIQIPAAFLLAELILSCPPPKRVPARLAGAGILAGCLAFGLVQARSLRINSPKDQLEASGTVLAYASAHPDTVLIMDPFAAPDIDAFAVYPDGSYPDNLIPWGGCDFFSRANRLQLANNGIQEPDETLFLDPTVRYLTREGSTEEQRLFDYLADRFPGISITMTDRTGEDYAVYRFEANAG